MTLLTRKPKAPPASSPKYPGTPSELDGAGAVAAVEIAASEALGLQAGAAGPGLATAFDASLTGEARNAWGRPIARLDAPDAPGAAAMMAGLALGGLRAAGCVNGQGAVEMHAALHAAAARRLTCVLHVAATALTKHARGAGAGHDGYHAVDDAGWFQLCAAHAQEAADLALVAHRVAELALTPGICAQDAWLPPRSPEPLRLPEPALVREYLGDAADVIECPTPAQRLVFGATRRRIPEIVDIDYPAQVGGLQRADTYAEGVAAERVFYADHLATLADQAFDEFTALTGRRHTRASGHLLDDAEYVIAAQGSAIAQAEDAAHQLRARGVRTGVLRVTMLRPFPADVVTRLLAGKRGVTVLERTDQPLAADLPLAREIRASLSKAVENGRADRGRARDARLPYPALAAVAADAVPDLFSACYGIGGRNLETRDIVAAVENMLPGGQGRRQVHLGVAFARPGTRLPKLQIWQERVLDAYPAAASASPAPVEDGGTSLAAGTSRTLPTIPPAMDVRADESGLAQPGRFWQQVSFTHALGLGGLADPFAASGVVPALSAAARDLSATRQQLPRFLPDRCTGCGDCWVQCPDSAIPAVVNAVEEVLDTAIAAVAETRPVDRLKQVAKHLAKECRALLAAGTCASLADAANAAYAAVVPRLGWDESRREELDAQFTALATRLAGVTAARTDVFFTRPEAAQGGSGGLLSIAVNPDACTGCGLCVDACADGALVAVQQTDEALADARLRWEFSRRLPDTADRFVDLGRAGHEGAARALLLKRGAYDAALGHGDCAGCGEKTVTHIVLAAIHAAMQPRVAAFVARLDTLISDLDARARTLLAESADLREASHAADGRVNLHMPAARRHRLDRIATIIDRLRDLRRRYTAGPGGRPRAALGMARAADVQHGGATYPWNPYPFPWTEHMANDAPAVALGLYEGHVRKMADGFFAVRRAEAELATDQDAAPDVPAGLDWAAFTDEEVRLCPPIVALGGDRPMFDAGLGGVSRMLASGKPLRLIVLDGSVSGGIRALGLGLAHGVFVCQSSQTAPDHLVSGLARGLEQRGPALFNFYAPCPERHGLSPDQALRAARTAFETRAVPHFTYDPDAGASVAERLHLLESTESVAAEEAGRPSAWAQLRELAGLDPAASVRERIASVVAAEHDHRTAALRAAHAKELADVRVTYAHLVARQLAEGLMRVAEGRTVAELVSTALAAPFEGPLAMPALASLVAAAPAAPAEIASPAVAAPAAPGAPGEVPAAPPAPPAPQAAAEADTGPMTMEAYIDSALCTSCNECTNLSSKLFAYNENKQAYIRDPRGGTFQQLVRAAEVCPVRIIHPGTPLDPGEKDLQKWIERAAPFN